MRTHDLRLRHLLLAALAGIALVAGACTDDSEGSKSDSDEKSETTDAGKDSEESTDSTEAPDETVPDDTAPQEPPSADFNETVEGAIAAIEDASDACELYDATSALQSVGNPETQEQTKLASEFYVAMLNKMAETSSDPEIAETLRTGAAEFEEFAQSADYDPEKMDLAGEGPDFESADALDEAMNTYAETEFVDCMGDTGTGDSAPTSTP